MIYTKYTEDIRNERRLKDGCKEGSRINTMTVLITLNVLRFLSLPPQGF